VKNFSMLPKRASIECPNASGSAKSFTVYERFF
jgi:hypothetical protein